jgi:hypothetical protein
MKTVFYVVLLLFNGRLQAMELRSSRLALPEGNVVGAAFYDRSETLFVQQDVYSLGEGGRGLTPHRLVSVWNLKNESMLTKRVLDASPRDAKAHPCMRIEAPARVDKIFVCGMGASLEVLEPDTLKTVGTIANRNDHEIYDFVIDDQRDRVFVLSLRGSEQSLHLASYSLSDGSEQQGTILPVTRGTIMRLSLVAKTGEVAIVIDRYTHGPQKSDIYVCQNKATLDCRRLAMIPRVLQIDTLGETLLGATDVSADHKKECLVSVDLRTGSTSREYCSLATGVHYAVGVASEKFIVGFTGTARRVWWREENLSEESSFSVWRAENPKVAAVAKDPTNFRSKQFSPSIFTSRTTPLFIVYMGNSRELYVYSILN